MIAVYLDERNNQDLVNMIFLLHRLSIRGRCDGECKVTCTGDGRKLCTGTYGMASIRATVDEENVLCTNRDPYHKKQNILVHEFSHTVMFYGLPDWQKDAVSHIAEKKGLA